MSDSYPFSFDVGPDIDSPPIFIDASSYLPGDFLRDHVSTCQYPIDACSCETVKR